MGARSTFLAAACFIFAQALRADTGDSVVVVYNSRLPASKKVAEHYASARQVPSKQLLSFFFARGRNHQKGGVRAQSPTTALGGIEETGLVDSSRGARCAEFDAALQYHRVKNPLFGALLWCSPQDRAGFIQERSTERKTAAGITSK